MLRGACVALHRTREAMALGPESPTGATKNGI